MAMIRTQRLAIGQLPQGAPRDTPEFPRSRLAQEYVDSLDQANARLASGPVYTVPAGYLAIIRTVDVYSINGSNAELAFDNVYMAAWVHEDWQIFFAITVTELDGWRRYGGTIVMYPGEILYIDTILGQLWYQVTGALLPMDQGQALLDN